MTKEEFLGRPCVADFCTWFGRSLQDRTIRHGYRHRRTRSQFVFGGLESALEAYQWPFRVQLRDRLLTGSSYADSAAALQILQDRLRHALEAGTEVAPHVCAVFRWGGVTRDNSAWAKEQPELGRLLSRARDIFRLDDDSLELMTGIGRFNAGLTKVYSLLLDDFVIYDSRVAAAVAAFVARWSQTMNTAVPEELRFRCMAARSAALRNPCSQVFAWMNSQAAHHARWNLRANWVLSQALSHDQGSIFKGCPQPMRALEAALFMWGYDLGSRD